MAESSPAEPSTMASNIDIAIATTSPSSEPSQAASTEPTQASTEPTQASKRHSRKTDQKRRPIIDAERKLLRDYFFKEKGGKVSYKSLIKWCIETYYRTLNQSTISELLATKFAYLDKIKVSHLERKKLRKGWYPTLKDALFE